MALIQSFKQTTLSMYHALGIVLGDADMALPTEIQLPFLWRPCSSGKDRLK